MVMRDKKVKKNNKSSVAEMVESIIGCKWSLRVLELIRNQVNRPGEMQRSTPGLSTKVLNERLSKLMHFDIISKKIYSETPPHVEYSFTQFGKKFISILELIEKLQRDIEAENTDTVFKKSTEP